MKINKLVFATDFSDVSKKALELVTTLKNSLGCEVHVIHVFDAASFEMPAPYYFMPGVEQWVDDHFSGLKEKGRNALSDLIPELGDDCQGHFLEGRPAHKIVEFAKENNADMIVMGTHGHTGLNHMLLGSVAEHVVRHATCAVLTVKGEKH